MQFFIYLLFLGGVYEGLSIMIMNKNKDFATADMQNVPTFYDIYCIFLIFFLVDISIRVW